MAHPHIKNQHPSTSAHQHIKTDICIIGAGPAGCIAAIRLAQLGLKSLLVDKAVFPRDKICGDALSGKVAEVLNKIDPGILLRFREQQTQLGAWGVTFVAPNLTPLPVPFKQLMNDGTPAPGYICKRINFDDFLLKETLKYLQVTLLENTALETFEKNEDGYNCYNKDKTVNIQARLVIAADGAHSRFARMVAGVEVDPKHYCAGIRAYYSGITDMDKNNFIELHFLKELLPGYFWIFPLPNGGANVGLGIRSDFVNKRKLNLKKLLPEVIEHYPQLKTRFQDAKLEDEIRGFGLPLGSKKRSLSGHHYMLAGDAASLIDPFTGEGIGNAMMSGMLAAEQAFIALEQNKLSATTLKAYDEAVYKRLWSELSISYRMQQLARYPRLFNLVVNKAARNSSLRETISAMFDNLDMRKRLQQSSFYFNLLFSDTK